MDGTRLSIRVLYIDDDPGIARLVQLQLGRAGYDVVTAGSGAEGLARAREEQFDAIALDHYMPGRDGLELLTDFQAIAGLPPIIFCTGADEPRIAVAALKNGAADYVLKDAAGDFIELLAASIAQEITRARLQRERDLAEREVRESRDRLEKLAAQQAVLLREVNHRVANSLQLISSLINLQARKSEDPTVRALLGEAVERVEAVTMAHRRLYSGDDVQSVAMDAYLDGLVNELSRTARAGITLETDIAPLRLATDTAVSLGLIVNELVTNALKYAFPEGRQGRVAVSLRREDDGAVRLVVQDDGVGTSGITKGSGLGSLIIASLSRGLGGQLATEDAGPGTRAVLLLSAVG